MAAQTFCAHPRAERAPEGAGFKGRAPIRAPTAAMGLPQTR